jgi:alpha-beta hydrolase superfamily lysophospholipase
MPTSTYELSAFDANTIFVRQWDVPQHRAVVVLVHGFGEHSGRYAHVAEFYNKNQISLVAFDNRGHGNSGGKRGHAANFESFLTDVETVLADVKKRYPKTPLVLHGHSMGGNIVLNYLLRRPIEGLSAALTTGPWIQLAFEPAAAMLILGKMMRSVYPSFSQPSKLNTSDLSRDEKIVQLYINDPLVHGQISASAGMGLNEAAAYLNVYEGSVKLPLLIMHGSADKIISPKASEAFANRVQGDITYKKWDGFFHEIHNEPEKIEVLTYALGWLDSKL